MVLGSRQYVRLGVLLAWVCPCAMMLPATLPMR
jgi:hypothetical protein